MGSVSRTTESNSKALYLVGMMGAGKSTIGPRLAVRLRRAFVDTDRQIVESEGRSIPEIFEQDGEAHFRALEARAIEEASVDGAVVALGGGAIVQPGMAERLAERGILIWLSVDVATLSERVGDGSSRPLLAGLSRAEQLEKLESLLEERRSYYEKATLTVDASVRTDAVVDQIVSALEKI